jgi:hypothetical protein
MYWLKKEKEKGGIGMFYQGEYKHKGCGGGDTQPGVGGGKEEQFMWEQKRNKKNQKKRKKPEKP